MSNSVLGNTLTITGRSYRLKDRVAKDLDTPKEQNKDEQDKNTES